MYKVFEGVRVVEVASWVFMPTAGAVMADWGADVIKVEDPIKGDPQRGNANAYLPKGVTYNPIMLLLNRGKRSVGIDIGTPEGHEILAELIKTADVFSTSYRASARQHLQIDVEHVRAINPNIVYAKGTGQGSFGPDAAKGGYDIASTWARSGMAYRLTSPGGIPPGMPASIGDLTSGVSAAGAVAAALFRRERTGETSTVEVSLYGMGMWIMSQSITASQVGFDPPLPSRTNAFNPLINCYQTKDERWIQFAILQGDRFWSDLCDCLDRPDLINDARFATNTERDRNVADCVVVLDEVFAQRTLEEWRQALEPFDGVWCPILSPLEVTQDPQVLANGYFPEVEYNEEQNPRVVASPMQFDDRPVGTLRPPPEHGQDTESVLTELGYSWDDIIKFKDANAII